MTGVRFASGVSIATAAESPARTVDRKNAVLACMVDAVRAELACRCVRPGEFADAVEFLVAAASRGELAILARILLGDAIEREQTDPAMRTEDCEVGPFYLADAPWLPSHCVLPQRPDEPGTPLVFSGRVVSTIGEPLSGAIVDLWHTSTEGLYSPPVTTAGEQDGGRFDRRQPPYNLRGRLRTDLTGGFAVTTILPASYPIPLSPPTTALLARFGLSPRRPAHIHFKITAEHCRPLTTQIYFEDDPQLDCDPIGAVKQSLVAPLRRRRESESTRWESEYTFRLAPLGSG